MLFLESILSGQENINIKQKRRHKISIALQIAGEKRTNHSNMTEYCIFAFCIFLSGNDHS